MTKWLALGGLAVLVLALGRVLAVGRKVQPTETERRRAAWGGMPVRYKRTQSAHWWKLKLRVYSREQGKRRA